VGFKSSVCWDVMLCSLEKVLHFGEHTAFTFRAEKSSKKHADLSKLHGVTIHTTVLFSHQCEYLRSIMYLFISYTILSSDLKYKIMKHTFENLQIVQFMSLIWKIPIPLFLYTENIKHCPQDSN
jgi:hypothetical protein